MSQTQDTKAGFSSGFSPYTDEVLRIELEQGIDVAMRRVLAIPQPDRDVVVRALLPVVEHAYDTYYRQVLEGILAGTIRQ